MRNRAAVRARTVGLACTRLSTHVLSEIRGPPDPVTDYADETEQYCADDPTDGCIPDQIEVCIVRWVYDQLAATAHCPNQETKDGPQKGKVDNFPFIDRSRVFVHSIL